MLPKGSDEHYSLSLPQPSTISYYRLKFVDNDGKVDFSDLLQISTKETSANIQVYPNPTSDQVHIVVQASTTLSIFDAQGKLMLKRALNKGDNEIDLTSLSSGVYFVVIQGQKTKLIKK